MYYILFEFYGVSIVEYIMLEILAFFSEVMFVFYNLMLKCIIVLLKVSGLLSKKYINI